MYWTDRQTDGQTDRGNCYMNIAHQYADAREKNQYKNALVPKWSLRAAIHLYIVLRSTSKLIIRLVQFLPRDAMHKRGLCRHAVCVCVCVSVCMSVTFVNSVKRNKHHHQIFFTILVFPCQTALQYSYSDDDLPLMGASNAGGVGRNCDSEPSVCC